jgi:hypothetical protein
MSMINEIHFERRRRREKKTEDKCKKKAIILFIYIHEYIDHFE